MGYSISGRNQNLEKSKLLKHPRRLMVFADLDQEEAGDVIEKLLNFDNQEKKDILIFLNSCGGDSSAFRALVDVMSGVDSRVGVLVLGEASSGAALVLAAGEKSMRFVSSSASIHLHETTQNLGDEWHTSEYIASEAEDTLRVNKYHNKMLAKFTGQTAEIVTKWRREGKVLSAKDAVKYGFADHIINFIDLD